MGFLHCSGGKTNNSQMSYFYFCDFNKVPGLNSFWLHSSNRLCLFSNHETNHTITLEAESLELHCLGYFEFPLFKHSHARQSLESLRTDQLHFIKAHTQIKEWWQSKSAVQGVTTCWLIIQRLSGNFRKQHYDMATCTCACDMLIQEKCIPNCSDCCGYASYLTSENTL